MSQWREVLQGSERCLWCHDYFDGNVGWKWVVGLAENGKLCPLCTAELLPIMEILCEECGRPNLQDNKLIVNPDTLSQHSSGSLCHDCLRWKEHTSWELKTFYHRALYQYNPFLQEILARFKYRGDVELAELFKTDLKKLGKKLGRFDVVTFIPLKESRQWERSFNQAEVLARDFSPISLLERVTTSSEKQSKRTREERILAMEKAFVLSKGTDREFLKGKSILIVDDIYTTGATLRSAATVFYENGAKRVSAVTVARAVGSKEMKIN